MPYDSHRGAGEDRAIAWGKYTGYKDALSQEDEAIVQGSLEKHGERVMELMGEHKEKPTVPMGDHAGTRMLGSTLESDGLGENSAYKSTLDQEKEATIQQSLKAHQEMQEKTPAGKAKKEHEAMSFYQQRLETGALEGPLGAPYRSATATPSEPGSPAQPQKTALERHQEMVAKKRAAEDAEAEAVKRRAQEMKDRMQREQDVKLAAIVRAHERQIELERAEEEAFTREQEGEN